MILRSILFAGALTALASPLSAFAQMGPPGAPPGAPSPEMHAQFEKTRAQYQTAALNDLSPDHREKVQAILAQVKSGSLDPHAAATQIDGILTPGESQAVLGEVQKMHAAIKAQMPDAHPPHGMMNRKPDAGRALMMLSMPPHGMMPPGAPQTP
ncbi:MAG TPA: hypothetical protein VJP85_01000 [Candidatus Baltobacteraceae bacterium]|nr:hypothetical protein [Candidatus Baltobacteraceae bacterium]